MEDFVFPASKIVLQSRKLNGEFPTDQATPVCSSPATVIAAYDLLVALCTGCVPNLKSLAAMLIDMYYSGKDIDISLVIRTRIVKKHLPHAEISLTLLLSFDVL